MLALGHSELMTWSIAFPTICLQFPSFSNHNSINIIPMFEIENKKWLPTPKYTNPYTKQVENNKYMPSYRIQL